MLIRFYAAFIIISTLRGVNGATECPVGKYCPKDLTSPINCPDGTFSNRKGIKSAADCQKCLQGFYCKDGAAIPKRCPLNFYCPNGTANPIPCPATGALLKKIEGCPVNGGFSEWSNWTDCSQTCFGGERMRVRYCDSPPPKYGGKDCVGGRTELVGCNDEIRCTGCPLGKYCPVRTTDPRNCPDGTYSDVAGIKSESQCKLCPNGFYCKNGASLPFRCPLYFYCPNGTAVPIPCPAKSGINQTHVGCPVDGKFSDWTEWTDCSHPCDGGEHYRVRYCDNPFPKYGGKDCTGGRTEWSVCNKDKPCNVDGGFSPWSEWGACSKTCAGGVQSRTRVCNNPPPLGTGRKCRGISNNVRTCNAFQCPANEEKTIVACENQSMSISCGPGGFIELKYANYGRTNRNKCGYNSQTGCRAANSWSYVYSRCHNKQSCYLKANNSEFGDPCYNVSKYLEVKYKCRR